MQTCSDPRYSKCHIGFKRERVCLAQACRASLGLYDLGLQESCCALRGCCVLSTMLACTKRLMKVAGLFKGLG